VGRETAPRRAHCRNLSLASQKKTPKRICAELRLSGSTNRRNHSHSRDKGNGNLIQRRDSRTRDANSEHQRGYLNPKYRAYFARLHRCRISMISRRSGLFCPDFGLHRSFLIALASTPDEFLARANPHARRSDEMVSRLSRQSATNKNAR